jgi:hypothetical protein
VTATKRSEVALRELNETLEQRVREAIAEREEAEEQLTWRRPAASLSRIASPRRASQRTSPVSARVTRISA